MARASVTINMGRVSKILDSTDANISPIGLAGYLGTVVSPHLAREAKSRFQTKGDNASGTWAPLAQSTQEIRANLGFTPDDINVRTGRMRDYMTNPSPVLAHDFLSTSMEWPGTPGANLGRRLAQAAGRGRGPARHVVAYDMNTVAFILRSLESWAVFGKAG